MHFIRNKSKDYKEYHSSSGWCRRLGWIRNWSSSLLKRTGLTVLFSKSIGTLWRKTPESYMNNPKKLIIDSASLNKHIGSR